MCDSLDSKKQAKELLNSLKVIQLFSVDILIEQIVITHGPYKNSGDLDNITETESEGETDHGGEEQEESLTVGMALLEEESPDMGASQSGKSRGTPTLPRIPKPKTTCHKIPIDSWPPGLISSKAYVTPVDEYPPELADQPWQRCVSCLEKCKGVKPEKIKKCECPKEICYKFPIDSWGPAIISSSGIERTKCVCSAAVDRSRGGKSRPKSKESSKGSSKGKDSKGKDKDGKGKGKGKGGDKDSKKGGKKKTGEGMEATTDEEDIVVEAEPPKPKKKNKRCKRPPKPEGPLPPLRATLSIFHLKDIKVNQVDLDKLYPPEDENPELIPDSEPEIQVEVEPEEIPEIAKKVKKQEKKPSKGKDKDAGKKSKDKGKGPGSKGSSKSSKSSKSSSSKQSKNVIKTTKDKKKGKTAIEPPEPPSEVEEVEEEDNSPMSKYRSLGGVDVPKCSGDLEAKLKVMGKGRRYEYKRRQQVIESLRASTEFMRGVSLIFASTPLDLITWLLLEKLEIQVDRCAPYGPVYPIGKATLKLPSVLRDRIQAGARHNRRRALWSCLEETFPIIDCKGQNVGDLSLYFCLTSLGKALVSTTLVSESNLYQYTDTACYIRSTETQRATAFATRYNNLHRLTTKHYDMPDPPLLTIN